jgi:3-hydroxybutyryl-CoA dehydrogenase
MSSLVRARSEIAANLDLLDDLRLLRGEAGTHLDRLVLTRQPQRDLAGCPLVFEALPETAESKRPFYEDILGTLGPDCVAASATSTFALEAFRNMGAPAGRVVTAHWLNPAFLMPLVEVAHADWTEPAALDRVLGYLKAIGKIAVPLRNSPGFIVPRIQVAAMNEAVRIVEEGVATAADVDTAIKAGFGFRLTVLGLMEFIDLGGLDILAHAGSYLSKTLGKEHFHPPASVQDKMEAGELGPRTGRGYYDYEGVNTAALFQDRYRAFADLLTHVSNSPYLSFYGGIELRGESHADQEERL